MGLPTFTDIISLSNPEISETIVEMEHQLFNLRLKKATRQKFKLHQIKRTKHKLAQLKTLLRLRFLKLQEKNENLKVDESTN